MLLEGVEISCLFISALLQGLKQAFIILVKLEYQQAGLDRDDKNDDVDKTDVSLAKKDSVGGDGEILEFSADFSQHVQSITKMKQSRNTIAESSSECEREREKL